MTEWIKVINNRKRCRVRGRKKWTAQNERNEGSMKKSGKNYRQIKYCKVSRSSISIAFTSAFLQCPSLSLSLSPWVVCLLFSASYQCVWFCIYSCSRVIYFDEKLQFVSNQIMHSFVVFSDLGLHRKPLIEQEGTKRTTETERRALIEWLIQRERKRLHPRDEKERKSRVIESMDRKETICPLKSQTPIILRLPSFLFMPFILPKKLGRGNRGWIEESWVEKVKKEIHFPASLHRWVNMNVSLFGSQKTFELF